MQSLQAVGIPPLNLVRPWAHEGSTGRRCDTTLPASVAVLRALCLDIVRVVRFHPHVAICGRRIAASPVCFLCAHLTSPCTVVPPQHPLTNAFARPLNFPTTNLPCTHARTADKPPGHKHTTPATCTHPNLNNTVPTPSLAAPASGRRVFTSCLTSCSAPSASAWPSRPAQRRLPPRHQLLQPSHPSSQQAHRQ